ncbi:MAG: hypothetical protein AAGC46_05235 [Solirubrobacteraceae bacterium]|nr:hypothetical protein [Patulibacter sp.]
MAKSGVMPEGHLHAVVDAIAAAGSQQLARRAAEGAPVPFDLVEVPSSGAGAPLFSYRPRTRDFVEEHIDSLRQLMAWTTAVNVLAGFDGLGDYLLSHGERHVPIDARDRADLTLRVLLARMHEDTGDFIHTPQRSAAAADELARCLLAGRVEGTVVVPILGVRLDAERLKLEDGLELVRDDVVEGLPREARSPVRTRPGTVVVVSSLEDPARAAALAQARPRLRALLTALRLYGHPAPALAPVAWSRMRGDGWASHPFIGTSARATGTLHITAEEEPSIVGFCALMAQRSFNHGTPAWAMRRFELACERPDHGESLTDTLLGLRALLEADQLGSGALSERLAALCAAPGEWHALRDRVQIAEALEVSMMQGTTTDPTRTRALSLELRGHLRALLRDMACGHLPVDLVDIAEHHLAHDDLGAPVEVSGATFVEDAVEPDRVDTTFEAHPVVATDTRDSSGIHPAVQVDDDPSGSHAAVHTHDPSGSPAAQGYAAPQHPQPASEYLTPAPPADPAPLRPVAPAIPAAQRPVQVHRQPTADHAHDPRMVTANGERFEDAFIRSLSEGPGSLR